MTRALFLLAFGAMSLIAQPKPGTVTFTLVNSATQLPIPDVKIILSGSEHNDTRETLENGRAEFTGVAPGVYSYSVSPGQGFSESGTFREFITVAEGATLTVAPIVLIPDGSIEGIVKDQDGNPIAGAEVELLSYLYVAASLTLDAPIRTDASATTDEAGHYRLSKLRPGPVLVRARMGRLPADAKGFPLTYYPDETDMKQARRVQVPAGGNLKDIDFQVRLTEGFHVRGRVTAAANPEGVVTLTIRPCNYFQAPIGIELSEDGSFDIPSMLPDKYCLRYQELRLSDNAILAYAAAEVRVIDRDVDRVQLIPVAPMTISGVIQLEGDARLPQTIGVNATTFAVPGVATKIDAASRRFTIEGLVPGIYRLRIYTNRGYVKSVRLGTREIDPAAFTYYGELDPMTIQIAPANGSIHGKVVSNGKKLGGRIVVVVPAGGRSQREYVGISLNDQGEFRFLELPPGTYKVLAFESGDFQWAAVPEMRERLQGATVEMKDQQVEVEVRAIPASEVERAKASF